MQWEEPSDHADDRVQDSQSDLRHADDGVKDLPTSPELTHRASPQLGRVHSQGLAAPGAHAAVPQPPFTSQRLCNRFSRFNPWDPHRILNLFPQINYHPAAGDAY